MSMRIDKVTGKQKKAIDAAIKSARPNGNGKNPQTAQQTITFQQMYRDGICKVTDKLYTKTIQFFDINYTVRSTTFRCALWNPKTALNVYSVLSMKSR